MASVKMTAKEFDELRPRLGRLSLDTVDLAREVLVNGKTQSNVAREYGLSRQRVNGMVSRVIAAANEIPLGWKRVDVWLPPDLAEEVQKMEANAKAATRRRKKGGAIMLTEHEIAQRRRGAENALGSQRLEGLEPDPHVVAQMERYIVGELEIEDIVADVIARVKRGEVGG